MTTQNTIENFATEIVSEDKKFAETVSGLILCSGMKETSNYNVHLVQTVSNCFIGMPDRPATALYNRFYKFAENGGDVVAVAQRVDDMLKTPKASPKPASVSMVL